MIDVAKNRLMDKINSYRNLKDNWSGTQCKPFKEEVINNALTILNVIKMAPSIFPTPRQSIQFEWNYDGFYIELEIYDSYYEVFIFKYNKFTGLKGLYSIITILLSIGIFGMTVKSILTNKFEIAEA